MPSSKPALTPEYYAARHRRQVRLQIWLPVWVAILLVVGLAALAILGTVNRSSEVNRWGSISAVLLIIPNLLTSLVSMAVLFLSVRGLSILYRKLPAWMHRLQGLLQTVQSAVRNLSDKAVSPLFSIHGAGAGLGAVRDKISGKKHTRSS